MSLAWGSLAIREGRGQSTRRRKSAASGAALETLDGSPRALGTLLRARSSRRGEGPRRGSGAPRTWSAPGGVAADRARICPGPAARGRSGRGPWGFLDPRGLARGRRRGRALANTAALQSQVLRDGSGQPCPSALGFPAAAQVVPRAGGASSAPGETSPTPAPDTCCAPLQRFSSGHVSGGQGQHPQTCRPQPGGPGLCAARPLTQVSAGPGYSAKDLPPFPGRMARGGATFLSGVLPGTSL